MDWQFILKISYLSTFRFRKPHKTAYSVAKSSSSTAPSSKTNAGNGCSPRDDANRTDLCAAWVVSSNNASSAVARTKSQLLWLLLMPPSSEVVQSAERFTGLLRRPWSSSGFGFTVTRDVGVLSLRPLVVEVVTRGPWGRRGVRVSRWERTVGWMGTGNALASETLLGFSWRRNMHENVLFNWLES